MEKLILKAEASLRFCCLMFSVLAACLVGFDKQTKQVFFTVTRTATYRSLGALETLAIVEAVVAGYHLVQLAKCAILVRLGDCTNWCRPCFSWVCFLLDQVTAYVSLAVTSAATQASILAITGAGVFQWSKVCHIYTRFCDQIGGGIGAALIAAAIAAALASLSAFRLFRLFSPNRYFALKEKRVARASPAAA